MPHEVREALNNKPRIFFRETGHVEGEHLYEALSRTNAGRYLAVFFIRKPADKALIVSALDDKLTELVLYAKELCPEARRQVQPRTRTKMGT